MGCCGILCKRARLSQGGFVLTLFGVRGRPPQKDLSMSSTAYVPPKVWTWDAANGGQFASINRPIAGATHDKELPRGKHGFQLYSLATPNGQKVSIMFEELLAAGHAAEYDAWLINIGKGDQFGSGFVAVNPNSKIPALLDLTGPEPVRLFESGSMLVHLADKFGAFLPARGPARTEVMNWLFWQMGSAPFVGGGFGHFFAYAPGKVRISDQPLCDGNQSGNWTCWIGVWPRCPSSRGQDYSIADMAIWPWYGSMVLGRGYANSAEFLDVGIYKNLKRWADAIDARPAVKRGRIVNRNWGDEAEQVPERHGPRISPARRSKRNRFPDRKSCTEFARIPQACQAGLRDIILPPSRGDGVATGDIPKACRETCFRPARRDLSGFRGACPDPNYEV